MNVKQLMGVGVQFLKDAPARLKGAPDGLPIPLPWLLYTVAGTPNSAWFLKSGSLAAESIISILSQNSLAMDRFEAILDFGCGCGRVIRHFHGLKSTRLYGTDYNPALVEWCARHLPFAQFGINQLRPPLEYADEQFDFVYALSVFTHIPEALQLEWLDEMARVIRPGGYLLITTHGEWYFDSLTPSEQEQFRAGYLVVREAHRPGTNFCSTFHPVSYVQTKLTRHFSIVDFIPQGAKGNPQQDVFLLQRHARVERRLPDARIDRPANSTLPKITPLRQ